MSEKKEAFTAGTDEVEAKKSMKVLKMTMKSFSKRSSVTNNWKGPKKYGCNSVVQNDVRMDRLTSLIGVPQIEIGCLLKRNLDQCCHIFDFSDSQSNIDEKEIKRKLLMDLREYLKICDGSIMNEKLGEIFNMISTNIFRTLSSSQHEVSFREEEEEQVVETSWPHLSLVEEILFILIRHHKLDLTEATKYINNSFIRSLIDLFKSEDSRERAVLRSIIHVIYRKFPGIRSEIRDYIQSAFLETIYEKVNNLGISELLEVVESIVSGFAIPIKQEHIQFLYTTLVPLYRCPCYSDYSEQLSLVIHSYVKKDSTLLFPIVKKCIRYISKHNPGKKIVLIHSIYQIILNNISTTNEEVIEPFFRTLIKNSTHSHHELAHASLLLMRDNFMVEILKKTSPDSYDVLVKTLKEISSSHWMENVRFEAEITLLDIESINTFTLNSEL